MKFSYRNKLPVMMEIGNGYHQTRTLLFLATEIKCLQGAAAIQSTTGVPVIIHPGRNHEAPFEIMRIVQEAGGNASKTVMSHLDRKCSSSVVIPQADLTSPKEQIYSKTFTDFFLPFLKTFQEIYKQFTG
jgi:hypothetical protein